MDANNFLKPKEVAKMLGVCTRTIYRWCRTGRIKAVNLGEGDYQLWRIRSEDLERFISANSNTNQAA